MTPRSAPAGPAPVRAPSNDVTPREGMWRRIAGNDWAAFEALPPAVRARVREHAYDAWAVNALVLWRMFRRRTASNAHAERRLLRYLDECEALERAAFSDALRQDHGAPLRHVAARATVLRYGAERTRRRAVDNASCSWDERQERPRRQPRPTAEHRAGGG